MIKLTKSDGKPLYVNAEAISATSLKPSGETRICIGSTIDDAFIVTESPEEVTRKIMEYKTLMVKLRAYYNGAAITDDAEIEAGNLMVIDMVKVSFKNLAGLEDSGHDQ